MLRAGPVLYVAEILALVTFAAAIGIGRKAILTPFRSLALGVAFALAFIVPIISVVFLSSLGMEELMPFLFACEAVALVAAAGYAFEKRKVLPSAIAATCFAVSICLILILLIFR